MLVHYDNVSYTVELHEHPNLRRVHVPSSLSYYLM